MALKIAVDIDLTMTRDLGLVWWDFLQERYSQYQSWDGYVRFCTDHNNGNAEYNLTKYFNIPDGENPYSFWYRENLYDTEPLVEGCYDVLKSLHEQGVEFMSVSHTYAEHAGSKLRFLKRNLDFLDNVNFVVTMDKSCMNGCVDIVIDDRLSNLTLFDDYILKLQYKTPYKQDVELVDKQVEVCEDWEEVGKHIEAWRENN